MDQNRQVRFLIPPFVFLFSLFCGDFLDIYELFPAFFKEARSDTLKVLATLLFGGAGVIALGFIIGSISMCFFELRKRICKKDHEPITKDAVRHFLQVLDIEYEKDYKDKYEGNLYAVGVIHHGLLTAISPGLSDWITRRWNIFTVSLNCFVALILSFSIGAVFQIAHLSACLMANCEFWKLFDLRVLLIWWILYPVIGLILCFNAKSTHKEITNMFSFIAQQTTSEDGNIRISIGFKKNVN